MPRCAIFAPPAQHLAKQHLVAQMHEGLSCALTHRCVIPVVDKCNKHRSEHVIEVREGAHMVNAFIDSGTGLKCRGQFWCNSDSNRIAWAASVPVVA